LERKIASVVLSVAVATMLGCGQQGDPAQEEDLSLDGRADSTNQVIDHTTPIQEIGEIGVSLSDKIRGHSWTFTLGMQEMVGIYTALYSGDKKGPEVDTVLYLYKKSGNAWGSYIQRNDNASAQTKYSRIDVVLDPGEYRIVVKGRNKNVLGQFAVNLRCADGFCDYYDPSKVSPPEEDGIGEADKPGAGVVSFRLPLIDETGELLSQFNDRLSQAGLPTFPDFITVSSANNPVDAEFSKYNQQASQKDILAITNSDLQQYVDPDVFTSPRKGGDLGFCYEGDGTALADFMWSFADSIFSDQFVVYGWRADGKSAYEEYHEPTKTSGMLEEWSAFDAASDSVLVVYSTDDDGNGKTITIPHCQ
jgi:hypothetical protein